MKTYGTMHLAGGEWVIQAEPHVAMRLRRMFRKAERQIGTVNLQATDEVCRDLLWFTQRYPFDVDPVDALEGGAAKFDERVERFDALLAGRIAPRAFELAVAPRHYQQIAADIALQSGGLLIADDVGLGKTASAIAGLTDPATRPALVVTLTHLPVQWQREIVKFAPGMTTHIIKKGTPYGIGSASSRHKQLSLSLATFPDVVICNYHKLRGWSEALHGKIRTVVFDECQELRRSESAKYAAAEHIASGCDYRWGLSATPIYNFGVEFHNVMHILTPGALGARDEFLREWCRSSSVPDKAQIDKPKAFGTYVREAGLMVRRTRADVKRELPGLTKSIYHVDTEKVDIDKLVSGADELARIVLDRDTAWKEKGAAARDLDWKLRHATGVAKAPLVADFVQLLAETGEKVVLYGWHRDVYTIWEERLRGLRPVFFTGSESAKEKERSRYAFCSGRSRVLVMSLRAGAGLDGLQRHCRTLVFGELDWSPMVHEQCTGRVYRDGQPDPVVAYYAAANSGSDPVVMDVLGVKREQIEGIRNPTVSVMDKPENAADRVRRLAEYVLQNKTR